MGTHLVQGLQDTGKHVITAITRHNSATQMPSNVKVVKVDYEDESSLISAMTGQQFLIISLPYSAAPETQTKLIAAAGKAGVPYIMPNGFGIDFANERLAQEALAGMSIRKGIADVQELAPKAKWVVMVCGFWIEYAIAMGTHFYGLDLKNRKATLFDDGTTKINTSTWDQCRRAIGAFLSLPELPQDASDTQPTISQWANKGLYISSFLVSQRDMLDSVQRNTHTSDADWTTEYEPTKERRERGLSLMKEDPLNGFAMALFSRVFYPNGGGNFEEHGLANGALDLPQESLDEATQRALELVDDGYNPFLRESVRG